MKCKVSAQYIFSLFILMSMLILGGCTNNQADQINAMAKAGLEVDGDNCVQIDEKLFDYQNTSFNSLWQVQDSSGASTSVIMWTVETVRNAINEKASLVYTSIADLMRATILAAGALMIILYFMSIVIGLTRFSTYMTLMVGIKLIVVFILVSPDAWVYSAGSDSGAYALLVKGFFEGLVNDISSQMVVLFSENDQIEDIFMAMDRQTSTLLSMKGMVLISALFSSGGPTGFLFGALLAMMIFNYLLAVLTALKVFLVSMILRHLLYSVGAVFVTSLFFKQTKSLFTGWMEQIISFTLQPIFIFIFLGMFSSIIGGFAQNIYRSTGQDYICYRDAGDVAGVNIFSSWQFGKKGSGTGSAIDKNLPLNLWVIISILLVTQLMKQMLTWSVNVAQRISGGLISATSATMPGEGPLNAFKDSVIKPVSGGIKGALGIGQDGVFNGKMGFDGARAGWQQARDKTKADYLGAIRREFGGNN